jgi:glyoxylate reductase
VLVTRRVPARVLEELDSSFELDVHDSDLQLPADDLCRRAAGCSGLMTMLSDRVDEALLDAAGPQLRVVANYAVGFDNVDLAAARDHGVVLATTPDVLTRATAEHAIALMLALLRRVAEGDRFLRRREDWPWAPTFMLGTGLDGKVLGVVGYGRIGREVARLGRALGMRVVHTSRTVQPDPEWRTLGDLLGEADVVSLHVPATTGTRHLIDAGALSLMGDEAVLVNTARGSIVDEESLAAALREGRIAGAALDVFEAEPHVPDSLLALENVVLTPHLGSATVAAREGMGMLCVEALRAVLLEDRRPANALDLDALTR